jgi:hypothetical protein
MRRLVAWADGAARAQAVASFYNETATVVWNGHAQAGLDAVRKLFTDLPSSKHVVLGFDAQPIFGAFRLFHAPCAARPPLTWPVRLAQTGHRT